MWRTIGFAVIAAAAASGCKPSVPQITLLEGQVTFDGKPLKAGYVQFVSDDNVTSTGAELTAEGRYRIAGAPVGPCKIAVTNRQFKVMEPSEDDPSTRGGNKPNPRYTAVPDKYGAVETSGLATTIEKGQKEYNIDLKSK
jgi:hypothetical protein